MEKPARMKNTTLRNIDWNIHYWVNSSFKDLNESIRRDASEAWKDEKLEVLLAYLRFAYSINYYTKEETDQILKIALEIRYGRGEQ